jgi:hypothetical protein
LPFFYNQAPLRALAFMTGENKINYNEEYIAEIEKTFLTEVLESQINNIHPVVKCREIG